MILAPAAMSAEKDPREAAKKCLEINELDPESYRIGHTKARKYWVLCRRVVEVLLELV